MKLCKQPRQHFVYRSMFSRPVLIHPVLHIAAEGTQLRRFFEFFTRGRPAGHTAGRILLIIHGQ
jgi:hypothetical protein